MSEPKNVLDHLKTLEEGIGQKMEALYNTIKLAVEHMETTLSQDIKGTSKLVLQHLDSNRMKTTDNDKSQLLIARIDEAMVKHDRGDKDVHFDGYKLETRTKVGAYNHSSIRTSADLNLDFLQVDELLTENPGAITKINRIASTEDELLSFINESWVKCSSCSFKCLASEKNLLELHKKDDHYCCQFCSFMGDTEEILNNHITSKHMSFKTNPPGIRAMSGCICKLCGYKAAHNAQLQRHVMYGHKQGESYVCEVCGFSAGYDGALNTHIMTDHVKGSSWFKVCNVCGYENKGTVNMLDHVKTVHKKTISQKLSKEISQK